MVRLGFAQAPGRATLTCLPTVITQPALAPSEEPGRELVELQLIRPAPRESRHRGRWWVSMHQQRREGRSQRAVCARATAGVLHRRPDTELHSNYQNPSLLMNIPSSGLAVLSRSRDVGLSVLHVIHAAQVPFGVPDPYPADPTHPSAWYTCRAVSQPAIMRTAGPDEGDIHATGSGRYCAVPRRPRGGAGRGGVRVGAGSGVSNFFSYTWGPAVG